MREHKTKVGVAVVLVLLMVLWVFWPRSAASPVDVAGVDVERAVPSPTPSARPEVVVAEPEALAVSPEAKAVAQLADLHGYGWVRCTFPDDALSGEELDGPLQYQHWDGRVLTGATAVPEVEMAVWTMAQVDDTGVDIDTLPPATVLRWTGAHPGEQGHCTVSAPARVTVRGRLVWPDGRPMAKQALEACDEDLVTDADGRFETQAWGAGSCFYAVEGYALAVGDQTPDTYPSVDVGLEDAQVELVVVDKKSLKRLTPEAQLQLAETLDPNGAHPLAQLLASPDLDPAARPQVEAWYAEYMKNQEDLQEVLNGLRSGALQIME
jgi:hypothetical protein